MTAAVLSPRQRECLALARQGLTSDQIAAALELSRRTVDQYIGEGGRRLGARNRAQAVAEAMARGEI
jgi:LuxR family transcriptional regulator of spore coat protein